jgi:hypothetical protein
MSYMQSRRREFAFCNLLALILTFLSIACNDQAAENERLQEEWNIRCRELAAVLGGIKDVRSAKDAEPYLRLILQRMKKVEERLGKTYDPEDVDPRESRKMSKAVAQGIEDMQRLNLETLRISKEPELVAALGDTWKKLPSVFMLEASGAIPKSK